MTLRAECTPFRPSTTKLQVLDRASFEREYRACIDQYLSRDLPIGEGRALLDHSEALTQSFAAVVGLDEAKRIGTRLLERVANIYVPAAVVAEV